MRLTDLRITPDGIGFVEGSGDFGPGMLTITWADLARMVDAAADHPLVSWSESASFDDTATTLLALLLRQGAKP